MAITLLKVMAAGGGVIVAYFGACIALLPVLHWHHESGMLTSIRDDVLADFGSHPACPAGADPGICSKTEQEFFFGIATAPAHSEDDLNDTWLEYARGHDDHYPVRAWQNVPIPDQRLRFWTEPDIELDLAKELGITVYRLGIDWGRLVPKEPINGTYEVADFSAVQRYKDIFQAVRDREMKVMLTLFHHSIPKWALLYGGWTEPRTVAYFTDFTRFAQKEFGEYVDYWITFNDPQTFVSRTHCTKAWPPGGEPSRLDALLCFTPFRAYGKAMAAISQAHKDAYKALHDGDASAYVGVTHHVAVINPYALVDVPRALVSRWLKVFPWIDDIQYHLDFCGINYYGQTILSMAGEMLVPSEEYSEHGRAVYPDGLVSVLTSFHKRYKKSRPNLRFLVSENGIGDQEDVLRRTYLLENLLAVNAARKKGVPLDGYIEWTVSDNWEWTDGYCPKFGLVDVDRADNLTRIPRPSYYLYQKVCKTGLVTASQRKDHWEYLRAAVCKNETRSFCREADEGNRLKGEPLDEPVKRLYVDKDWRFGHYTYPSLQTYIIRSREVMAMILNDAMNWGLSRRHDVALIPQIASQGLSNRSYRHSYVE